MDQALKTMINNMPEKTGHTLAEWKVILKKADFAKHSEAVDFLKKSHGVTHGYANTIVTLSKEDNSTEVDLLKAQYAGKEVLIPIYDKLVDVMTSFGDDVKVTPKKTSVSLIRKRQFALIKPATKKRIDLGLKLKDTPPKDRLGPSGPFGTMCTHRIQLTDINEIDKEVTAWLKAAYDLSV